ncbi:hypothetical protein Mth01_21080 [Sphaerimonospora thailandensis]|uniref:Uncharacterized protein n=1 Tax=Sphaerimonospora thailandensis TaxID=795644 RepID=A0A8J3R8K2_9ACTN|nr:hypothetical protein Mth01_21080 [Sphaerimonospora thailandensis]
MTQRLAEFCEALRLPGDRCPQILAIIRTRGWVRQWAWPDGRGWAVAARAAGGGHRVIGAEQTGQAVFSQHAHQPKVVKGAQV